MAYDPFANALTPTAPIVTPEKDYSQMRGKFDTAPAVDPAIEAQRIKTEQLLRDTGGMGNFVNELGQVSAPTPVSALKTPNTTPTTPPNTNASSQLDIVGMKAAEAAIEDAKKQAEADAKAKAESANPRDTAIADYLGVQNQMKGRADETAKLQEEQDLAGKMKVANDINSEILVTSRAYDKRIKELEKNSEGALTGALNADISRLRKEKNEELADLSIRKAVALGDIDTANKIVETAINAKYEPLQNQLDSLKDLISIYGDDMSESEKFQAQQEINKQEGDLSNNRQLQRDALNFAQTNGDVASASDILRLDPQSETFKSDLATKQSAVRIKPDGDTTVVDITGKIVPTRTEAQKLNKELTSTDTYKAVIKGQDSLQFLKSFEDLFNKTGATSGVFSPRQNAELKAKYNAAILNLKEFFNLGVLNGPDEAILKSVLPDPTNRSAFATTASLGIYKPSANTKAGIDNMKAMIDASLDTRYKTLVNQYGDYSADSVSSLKDLQRIYVEQKSKINPEVKKMVEDNPDLTTDDLVSIILK